MSPATQRSPIINTAARREYGLDWLRVGAFAMLIFYHSAMIFVPWDFHIKNAELSPSLAWPMLFLNRWRLPLLFLISGCGVAFSLRRRSLSQFSVERLRRLLIPVVFGMFVIVPPQIYFERLQQGATFGYGEFYRSVFDFVSYPKGSFSWHHLWFVVYILVYSLVGIPVFAFFRSERGQQVLERMSRFFFASKPSIYLVNVPSITVALTLGLHWPTTHNLTADWANLVGSFVTFLWGFVLASSPALLDVIERRRREFLIGGIAMAVIFFAIQLSGSDPGLVLMTLVNAYFGMLWIFTLVGYARARIHSGGPWLAYLTEAVYPFYIVHQTITIAAGFYIIQQPWSIVAKLLLIMLVTLIGSWITFEVVRRTWLTRLLFGLKP